MGPMWFVYQYVFHSRGLMKPFELYPWTKTTMWNAITVRWVQENRMSHLSEALSQVPLNGSLSDIIASRSLILITVSALITHCWGEQVCNTSSSLSSFFSSASSAVFVPKADWRLLFSHMEITISVLRGAAPVFLFIVVQRGASWH